MNSKDRYWLHSGVMSIFQSVWGLVFGFGGFYILVRQLNKDDFGTWALFSTTVMILEFIRNGLVQNALIKFLATDKDSYNEILSASFTISGILSLFCIIINLTFAKYLAELWHSPALEAMFYLYNVVYIFTGILSQFQFIGQANLDFKGSVVSAFSRQGVFFIYILTCFILKAPVSLLSLVYMQGAGIFVATLVAWLYARKYLGFKYALAMQWVWKLFNYGKYAFGTTISAMLSNSLDQMMLGSMLTTAAAGSYSIAIRITNIIEIPTSSVASIVFPQSAIRMQEEGEQGVKRLYEKSVGTILAILIPGLVLLLLFAENVVDFITSSKYPETIPILQITVLYCILIPYGRQFGIIFDSIGKTRITFIIVVITAAINAGLNYLFIRRYGAIGAAIATLLANIVGFIIAQIMLYRTLGINSLNPWIYAFKFYPEFYKKYLVLYVFKAKKLTNTFLKSS